MRIERQVLFWLAVGLAVLGLIALLKDILLPFVAGMVLAYFLNPIADRIERLGLGRLGAAILIVALVAVLVVLAMVLLVPFGANQLRQLAETLPADIDRLKQALETWAASWLGDRYPMLKPALERAFSELSQNWSGAIGTIVRSLWSQGLAIVNFVSLLLVTPVVVFYLLVDWHPMLDKIDGWLPRDHAETIRRLADEINDAVSAFIRGQGTICIIMAIFYTFALSWAGVRYSVLIGLATGVVSFIPFVGWALGFLTAGAMAVTDPWPNLALLLTVAGIFFAGMAIDSAVLSPKIVGSKIGLHPVWLVFALFVFSYLFGFVGILVAVPVAAAFGVLVRFALDTYLASSVYRGTGHAADAEPPKG
ncbi:MAG TPA: AI-2E family transporter [Hyphomicrobiaceae bacterium]|nr:AI-2E family transporter [Hyphomicrobiaceae bacterium]